jgi:dTMP kinase
MTKRTSRGLFITVEGVEGVGKSTNLGYIAEYLRRAGKSVIVTREPGGTELAEQIRSLLLDSEPGDLPDTSELLLMFAARAVHLAELIRPALQRGDCVVCDRFTDATYAYQGGGRGFSTPTIAWLEEFVQQGLAPDLTLLLDAPLELVEQRRAERAVSDRFELEQKEFFLRVQATYREIAGQSPGRVKLINAGETLPAVQRQIARALSSIID